MAIFSLRRTAEITVLRNLIFKFGHSFYSNFIPYQGKFSKRLIDKTIQKIQGQFDANKDGIVAEKEIDAFLKNKYNMKLEDAKKMNVKKFVDTLQAKDEARKKAEKK